MKNFANHPLLAATARGTPMQIAPGTGFGFAGMVSGTRYLMSGADAQKVENIIALFEKINGRSATDKERANVERKLKVP